MEDLSKKDENVKLFESYVSYEEYFDQEDERIRLEDSNTKASDDYIQKTAVKGFRLTGARKNKLLVKVQQECIRLLKVGIKPEVILNQSNWKGPLKTTTKELTGIISLLRQF